MAAANSTVAGITSTKARSRGFCNAKDAATKKEPKLIFCKTVVIENVLFLPAHGWDLAAIAIWVFCLFGKDIKKTGRQKNNSRN